MKKRQQLPNLCKGIKSLIGHIKNDNERFHDLSFQDHTNIFYNEIFNENGIVTITHDNHKEFLKLVDKIKIVFDAENIEYDTEQIEERLSKFILQTIEEFLSCETERIESFIEKLKVPEYKEYFFRLYNFDYKHQTKFGKHIRIIKGREIKDQIPNRLNHKVEPNTRNRNIIQNEDVLL